VALGRDGESCLGTHLCDLPTMSILAPHSGHRFIER
jgi:hypothetical protein